MDTRRTSAGPASRARRVVLALLLAGARFGMSQNISTAQLSGTVRDPSGALVSGATVVIADPTKGFSRTVQADARGTYQARFCFLRARTRSRCGRRALAT